MRLSKQQLLKSLLLCLFVLAFMTAAKTQHLLKIEISGLRNSQGQIILELLDKQGEHIKGVHADISDKSCSIEIPALPTAGYMFKYFHDENSNLELDMNWIGIPKEGYGFSNNATGRFGPPDEKDMIFDLDSSKKMNCSINYLF